MFETENQSRGPNNNASLVVGYEGHVVMFRSTACLQRSVRRVGQNRLARTICRVGQNRIYTPYMTVYLVISLPKIPYIHRIYMVLANSNHMYTG